VICGGVAERLSDPVFVLRWGAGVGDGALRGLRCVFALRSEAGRGGRAAGLPAVPDGAGGGGARRGGHGACVPVRGVLGLLHARRRLVRDPGPHERG